MLKKKMVKRIFLTKENSIFYMRDMNIEIDMFWF